MKPTFLFTGDTGRASFFTGGQASRSLYLDYNFQAGGIGDFSGKGSGKCVPPFHRLSENYFNREARIHFAAEAAFFGLIVLTAAVPVLESIQALFRFVYGTL